MAHPTRPIRLAHQRQFCVDPTHPPLFRPRTNTHMRLRASARRSRMFVHAIYVFNMGVIRSGRGSFYGTVAAGVPQINAAEIMIASARANSFHAHSHTHTYTHTHAHTYGQTGTTLMAAPRSRCCRKICDSVNFRADNSVGKCTTAKCSSRQIKSKLQRFFCVKTLQDKPPTIFKSTHTLGRIYVLSTVCVCV